MPTPIAPGQLRALARTLAADGKLSKQDVGKLIDTAMGPGTLSTVAKAELREILTAYQDKMAAPDNERLKAFLAIPNATVRNLAHTLEKDDGVIDGGDAQKIADLVQKDGKISSNEKYSLAAVMVANKMTVDAKDKLQSLTGTPEQTGAGKPLDPTGTYRPVFLSPSGFFVEGKDQDKPRTPTELGSGLFRMADLVDDLKANPLAGTAVTAADRTKVLANLTDALGSVAVGAPAPAGLSAKQVLQMRSSAATVLLALAEAAGGDAQLKHKAITQYVNTLKAETNPILRDSMTWNLARVSSSLPADLKALAQPLVDQLAPRSPPYDEWFKNGNRTLNVSWSTGEDEEFFPGYVDMLKDRGFTPEGNVPARGPGTFVKKVTPPGGQEMEIRIKVGINRDDLFRDMNKEDVHIVGYDGHSDLGRTVPDALVNSPDSKGKKLIFTGLCAGKDNIHNMRERYPDAQVLTTFTSSYFDTTTRAGKKVMNESENFNTLMEVVEGSVKRLSWEKLNDNIRENGVLFPWSHVMPGGTNYISPVHTEIRRKVLDTDHDGQADYLDKFANFDTFKPTADTLREFDAVTPSRPAEVLEGTVPHLAAQALNTGTGYNSVTQDYKKQNILGDGYFTPKAGEKAIVRFEKDTAPDGSKILKMQVNANHAHMSVEGLRAVASYEFIQTIAKEQNLTGVDAKLMGLTFAAFSILYDQSRWGRDETIWTGMLRHLGLPENIPFGPISKLLDEEHHDYSGNMEHVRKFKAALPADILARLG
ncbi:MAG: hypothetical protein HY904_09645 [Deltaproteobacteria bacterium]|nr:hypothetical protein [Deltaproteobacteria bacterium]